MTEYRVITKNGDILGVCYSQEEAEDLITTIRQHETIDLLIETAEELA